MQQKIFKLTLFSIKNILSVFMLMQIEPFRHNNCGSLIKNSNFSQEGAAFNIALQLVCLLELAIDVGFKLLN